MEIWCTLLMSTVPSPLLVRLHLFSLYGFSFYSSSWSPTFCMCSLSNTPDSGHQLISKRLQWYFQVFLGSSHLKGWSTGFFKNLIMFMGCTVTCFHASSFFFYHIIFHIFYLYSTPLFYSSKNGLLTWFLSQKFAMDSNWVAGPVCCDSLTTYIAQCLEMS